MTELELRGPVLPPDFGDGWLSAPASDLVRIAVTLLGYPERETIRRVALAGNPGRTTNARTVERVLDELAAELEPR